MRHRQLFFALNLNLDLDFSAMPPKRSNPSASDEDGPPAKKAATKKTTATKAKTTKATTTKTTTKKAAATTSTTKKAAIKKAAPKKTVPKLKASTAPNWDEHSEWSQKKPSGKWAKKCVERWCLLPPYDTSIKEKQWQTYYLERSALDKVNSWGTSESGCIVPEGFGFVTWEVLRRASEDMGAVILGSSLDDVEHKKRIAYTLMGSLYFTDLVGEADEDGLPCHINPNTRLYSPFGIGTSIDSYYTCHYSEPGSRAGRSATLWVKSKTIDECDAKVPRACAAYGLTKGFLEKPAPGAVSLFQGGATDKNIQSFEKPLFGCEGWLSPLKLLNLLHMAATASSYAESDDAALKSACKKFQFFQGESNGKSALVPELARLVTLEKDEIPMPGFDEIAEEGVELCVPQRMLLLARQAEASDG